MVCWMFLGRPVIIPFPALFFFSARHFSALAARAWTLHYASPAIWLAIFSKTPVRAITVRRRICSEKKVFSFGQARREIWEEIETRNRQREQGNQFLIKSTVKESTKYNTAGKAFPCFMTCQSLTYFTRKDGDLIKGLLVMKAISESDYILTLLLSRCCSHSDIRGKL